MNKTSRTGSVAPTESEAGSAKGTPLFRLPDGGASLEQVERELVLQALERCAWNQTRAGALLGINRDQVRYRIEKFGLTVPPQRTPLSIPSTR
jgi:two-component system NtrC family response regulator